MAAESKLEQRCRKHAEANGYCLLKWVSPGVNGVPDRILLGPEMFLAFIEFKAPGETLRATQVLWLNQLQDMGFKAMVIWDFEDFLRLLPSN